MGKSQSRLRKKCTPGLPQRLELQQPTRFASSENSTVPEANQRKSAKFRSSPPSRPWTRSQGRADPTPQSNLPPPKQSKSVPMKPSNSTSVPMKPPQSTSTIHREEGNDFFRKFLRSYNSEEEKRSYLQSALRCYRQAYKEASQSEDQDDNIRKDCSSAAKNCGTATYKLIKVLVEMDTAPNTIAAYYKEAIEFISNGLKIGNTCMEDKWNRDLMGVYTNLIESSLEYLKSNLSPEMIAGTIEKQIEVMAEHSHKAKCFWEIADLSFQKGVVALGSSDFKTALHALHDCHRPLMELDNFLAFSNEQDRTFLTTEAAVMEKDVNFHLATAESLQAITIGDELLEVATKGNINLDLVYDILDWYRKAVLGARELEIQVEAMAWSRMARLFDKVLKIKYKSKEYYLRCVQLGVSLHRTDMQSEVWFKESLQALQRFQDDLAKNDDAVQQMERQKYLDELVKELEQLEEANNSAEELIRFVYATFPPKDPQHKIPEEEIKFKKTVKKGLLKAILHYHPDKQDVAQHGKKWQALCGEITRALTGYYEARKFAC